MYELKGNLTTIIKFVIMTSAPALGISEGLKEPLTGAIVGIICFILAYYDAKYTNTIITKEENIETETKDYKDSLNDNDYINEEYTAQEYFNTGGED